MERGIEDTHDLDENELDFDNLDEFDVDTDGLLDDVQQMPLRHPGKKRSRKKATRYDNIPADINDWRDPEDDIMFGFKE